MGEVISKALIEGQDDSCFAVVFNYIINLVDKELRISGISKVKRLKRSNIRSFKFLYERQVGVVHIDGRDQLDQWCPWSQCCNEFSILCLYCR